LSVKLKVLLSVVDKTLIFFGENLRDVAWVSCVGDFILCYFSRLYCTGGGGVANVAKAAQQEIWII